MSSDYDPWSTDAEQQSQPYYTDPWDPVEPQPPQHPVPPKAVSFRAPSAACQGQTIGPLATTPRSPFAVVPSRGIPQPPARPEPPPGKPPGMQDASVPPAPPQDASVPPAPPSECDTLGSFQVLQQEEVDWDGASVDTTPVPLMDDEVHSIASFSTVKVDQSSCSSWADISDPPMAAEQEPKEVDVSPSPDDAIGTEDLRARLQQQLGSLVQNSQALKQRGFAPAAPEQEKIERQKAKAKAWMALHPLYKAQRPRSSASTDERDSRAPRARLKAAPEVRASSARGAPKSGSRQNRAAPPPVDDDEDDKEPAHSPDTLREYQFRAAPPGWEPSEPLPANYRIRCNIARWTRKAAGERPARIARGLVDRNVLPPTVPNLKLGEDFHRFYENEGIPVYTLLWTRDYDLAVEEKARRERGEGIGRDFQHSQSRQASSSSRRSRTPARSRGHSARRSHSQPAGNYAADDIDITKTTTSGGSTTTFSRERQEKPWSRSHSRGSASEREGQKPIGRGAVGELAAKARQIHKASSSSDSGSFESEDAPRAGADLQPNAERAEEHQREKRIRTDEEERRDEQHAVHLTHVQCLDYAEHIESRVRDLLASQGRGATYVIDGEGLLEITRALHRSDGADTSRVTSAESRQLLKELTRIDQTLPAPAQLRQLEASRGEWSYSRAAQRGAASSTAPSSEAQARHPPGPLEAIWKPGPGSRKIWKVCVHVIIDFAGTTFHRGEIVKGFKAGIKRLLLQNVVIHFVSFIGVEDYYNYFESGMWEGTRSDQFAQTIYALRDDIERDGFSCKGPSTEGCGWIVEPTVVNSRTGYPSHSPKLRRLGAQTEYTTGGKDNYAYKHRCSVIIDDHAGVIASAVEVGCRPIFVRKPASVRLQRPGVTAFTYTSDALDHLLQEVSNPINRKDLEVRANRLLEPREDTFTRFDCPDIENRHYAGFNFRPYTLTELQRVIDKHGPNSSGCDTAKAQLRPALAATTVAAKSSGGRASSHH